MKSIHLKVNWNIFRLEWVSHFIWNQRVFLTQDQMAYFIAKKWEGKKRKNCPHKRESRKRLLIKFPYVVSN